MKIGIYFNARRSQGGLYQYAELLIETLARHDQENHYTVYNGWTEPFGPSLPAERWRLVELPRAALWLGLGIEGLMLQAARLGWRRALRVLPVYRAIAADPPDVMLYVKPSIQSFLWPFPAVFPVHDLQHRLQPRFTELTAHGEFARREFMYQNALQAPGAVLTDSEIGREDVISEYGTRPDVVHVLPYLPSPATTRTPDEAERSRVGARYQVPPGYLFYPAAFWSHKNHARILDALAIARKEHGIRPPVLFAGSKNREYEGLVRQVAALDLGEQVRFLGYVPDEDLPALYSLATALVMPTYFGPTNIPVLEAWYHGCPVISSDLRGIRDQVGDAGLLVNPDDPRDLAVAIQRVVSDAALRADLAARGKARLAAWTPADFALKLTRILTGVGRP